MLKNFVGLYIFSIMYLTILFSNTVHSQKEKDYSNLLTTGEKFFHREYRHNKIRNLETGI